MNDNLDNLYHYKGIVERVKDGDTFVLSEIDLGFGVTLKSTKDKEWTVRMLGINTMEKRDKDAEKKKLAYEATDFMTATLPKGTEVIIKSHKVDDFGRILADVWTLDGTYLNKLLLDKGLAVEFMAE